MFGQFNSWSNAPTQPSFTPCKRNWSSVLAISYSRGNSLRFPSWVISDCVLSIRRPPLQQFGKSHTLCLVWFLCCNGTLPFVCCAEGISIRYELFGWIRQGTYIKDLSTHSSYYKSAWGARNKNENRCRGGATRWRFLV